MKQWFKVFGLSFFSDRIAKETCKHGYGNSILSLVLAFVFLMLGFVTASIVPFATHVDKSGEFNSMIKKAFASESGYTLYLENDTLKIGKHSQTPQAVKAINTYSNEQDAAEYGSDGYQLIVDTRPADTLIEFTQYAEDAKGNKISYEDYRALSADMKSGYSLKTEYTDEELQLSSDKIDLYVTFLENSESGKADYEELKNKSSNLSEEEYAKELHYLYVKYYYSGVMSVIYTAKAPVLHDYYYSKYLADLENVKFCYFFSNVCYGSFFTDGGVYANYGGYYSGIGDGTFAGEDVVGLIKDVFYANSGYVWVSYLMNSIMPFALLLLIPLLATLAVFALSRVGGIRQFTGNFGGCYKAVTSFSWFSAFATGLLSFILGFFVTANNYYFYMYAVFAAIILARSAVYILRIKNFARDDEVEQPEDNNV